MRLPRFRLRTLMIAVAVVGCLVWGLVLWRRSTYYWRRACTNGEMAQFALATDFPMPPEVRRRKLSHLRLALKYDRAARQPWLPVEPDPPPPD